MIMKPPAICEEGVGIKDIHAHLRKVENYQGRGSSESALFPTNLRQQVRQSDNGPHECV